MSVIIQDKKDAIQHINALFPIGQTADSDQVWLEIIQQYGVQHLPAPLLERIALGLLDHHGESVDIADRMRIESYMPDSIEMIAGKALAIAKIVIEAKWTDEQFAMRIGGTGTDRPMSKKEVLDYIDKALNNLNII